MGLIPTILSQAQNINFLGIQDRSTMLKERQNYPSCLHRKWYSLSCEEMTRGCCREKVLERYDRQLTNFKHSKCLWRLWYLSAFNIFVFCCHFSFHGKYMPKFLPNFVFLILILCLKTGPPNWISFVSRNTWICPWWNFHRRRTSSSPVILKGGSTACTPLPPLQHVFEIVVGVFVVLPVIWSEPLSIW